MAKRKSNTMVIAPEPLHKVNFDFDRPVFEELPAIDVLDAETREKVYAVIYARYSSHNQREVSIEQQIRECREYATKNNIVIIAVYADKALTGTTDKRPEFQRMMKDAAKRRFQYVITYKVDRFARSRYDSAHYKARLRKSGVRVLYAAESIPDGPEGILLESILEGSAEYYSANLSQNVKRGLRDNALECKINNGSVPLGYRRSIDQKYEIDPAGAAVVREIFEMYNSGLNTRQICDIMNARGIRTSKGGIFKKTTLLLMLKNERYIGVYEYGDIRIEGGVPAIITKELFDSVQDRMDRISRAPASSWSSVDYLLTGKLFCGHCGMNMVGESGTSRTGDKHHYYTCGNRKRRNGCKKKPVQKAWIEEYVVRETVARVLVDDVIDRIADAAVALQERERDGSLLQSMEQQLAAIRKSLKNIMVAIEQGIITPTTKERMEELEEQRAELEAGIEHEKLTKPALTKEQIVFWMEKFRDGDINDEQYRTTVIETFINAIYLYDDHIKIAYNYSGDNNIITFDIISKCDSDAAFSGSILEQSSQPGKPAQSSRLCGFCYALHYAFPCTQPLTTLDGYTAAQNIFQPCPKIDDDR